VFDEVYVLFHFNIIRGNHYCGEQNVLQRLVNFYFYLQGILNVYYVKVEMLIIFSVQIIRREFFSNLNTTCLPWVTIFHREYQAK